MFRSAVLRAVRSISMPKVATTAIPRAVVFPTKQVLSGGSRSYSAPALLTQEQVQARIIDLLKGFDKVRGAQLTHAWVMILT